MFKPFRGAKPLDDALQNMERAMEQVMLLTATLHCMGMSLEPDEIAGIRNRLRSAQMDLLSANHQTMDRANALIDELKGANAGLGVTP